MNAPDPVLPEMEIALECRQVSHWFGRKRVLHNINLRIRRGQFLSLVGPSGCGKSTLLRAIVGTHPQRKGELLVHTPASRERLAYVTGPGRERGIVYQQYSLFPFLTAQQNVALGLMLDQTSIPFRFFRFPAWRRLRKQHLEEAAEFLKKVRLGDAITLYPDEMSGGMKQRVAIAQAMIMKPEIILLDEPFGALDEATREELQDMLLELYAENQAASQRGQMPAHTLIIVTHELNEALYVGDRLVGLSQYWNWKEQFRDGCPGATVIYDKPSPVFKPDVARDFEIFAHQREEVRSVVFDPNTLSSPDEHVTYWKEFAARPS